MRQLPPFAASPELEERVLQQRQRAGLIPHLVEQRVDKPVLEFRSGQQRRPLDRAAHFGLLHRPDQHLVIGHRGGEDGIGGALAIEVRAQREHDDGLAARLCGRHHEVIDQGLARRRVVTLREDFFELVHQQDHSRCAVEARRQVQRALTVLKLLDPAANFRRGVPSSSSLGERNRQALERLRTRPHRHDRPVRAAFQLAARDGRH